MTIKEIREALGMTQREFAEEIGVDRLTVSCWERGRKPTQTIIKRAVERLEDRAREALAEK